VRVVLFYQAYFGFSVPFFKLFFALDDAFYGFVWFVPHQIVDFVAFGETFGQFVSVLVDPAD
jgi:hypothetical protein